MIFVRIFLHFEKKLNNLVGIVYICAILVEKINSIKGIGSYYQGRRGGVC